MKNKFKAILIGGLCLLCGTTIVSTTIASNEISEAKATDFTYEDNKLSSVKVIDGYAAGSKYLLFTLDHSDFNLASTVDFNLDPDDRRVVNPLFNYREVTNFGSTVLIDGTAISTEGKNSYLRFKSVDNSIGVQLDESVYASIQEGTTLVVPNGTTFPSYKGMFVEGNNTFYKTTEEVTYTFIDGVFRKEIDTTSVETEVGSVELGLAYNGTDYFIKFHLTENDYNTIPKTSEYNFQNDYKITSGATLKNMFSDATNFARAIEYKGVPVNLENEDSIFINYRDILTTRDNISIKATSIKNTFKDLDTVKIPAGTTFPSFNFLIGQSDIIYETSKDKVFTYFNGEFHCCEENITNKVGHDAEHHWDICDVCGSKLNVSEHELAYGDKAPTCEEEGYTNAYLCEYCGYVEIPGEAISPLGHDFGDKYGYDEDNHWQICKREGCEETTNLAPHIYNEDNICEVCGRHNPLDENRVTKIQVIEGYVASVKYIVFTLDHSDFNLAPKVNSGTNVDFNLDPDDNHKTYPLYNYREMTNFGSTVLINGVAIDAVGKNTYFKYKANDNSIGMQLDPTVASNIKEGSTIVIPANTTFPSYQGMFVEGDGTIYVNKEELTFTCSKSGLFHCCNDNLIEGIKYDENSHWKECSVCGTKLELCEHHIISGNKAPTCTANGYENAKFCEDCDYVEDAGTVVPALGHDFTGNYVHDGDNHWKECSHEGCEEIENLAEHTFTNDPHVCDICGYTRVISLINVTEGYINGKTDNVVLQGEEITIIPNSCPNGKEFEGWYLNGAKISENATYSFIPEADGTYVAKFKDVEFIDYVAKDEESKNKKEEKSGCGSSIIASSTLVSIFSVLGVALLTKKKSK